MDWRRLSGNRFSRWRPFIRRVALLRTIIICGLLSRGCCLFIRWWQEAVLVLRRGGVKNVRLLLLLRNVKNEFHRLMHPRAVLPVKMNRMAVSQRTLATVMTFVFFYFVCIFLCWLALMCMGIGLEEAFGLSVSSIGNVGPGLGAFGPAFSWSALPDLAKWLLSFMMLIGRLEIFGVLLLLTPSFWDRR